MPSLPGRAMSCAEVSKELGIPLSTVSFIERRAMAKIKKNEAAREIFETFVSLSRERARQQSDATVSLRFAKSKRSKKN